MKKIILLLTIGLFFLSCSSDSNGSSSSGIYKWRFKLDGVLYEWEGNHLALDGSGAIGAGGQATYSVNSIALQKINSSGTPIISVTINFPTTSTGNFVFNASNTSQAFTLLNNQLIYSTIPVGGAMNVNISSLSNVTFYSNPTNPGKVIGTFSGTVKSTDGTSTATITDGYFEAARGQ